MKDRPIGRKVTGDGGVKIHSKVLLEEPHPSRYKFQLEGSAPKSLILDDLAEMLEARFRGDLGPTLTRSKDEATKRLQERMEKRMEAMRVEQEHYKQMTVGLEEKKQQYDKSAGEIRKEVEEKALGDVAQKRADAIKEIDRLDGMRRELEKEIGVLQETAESRKQARENATQAVLGSIAIHPVSKQAYLSNEQVEELADNLVSGWRESLTDYGQPMPSEYDDLTSGVARMLTKLVSRLNDAFGDRLRNSEPEKSQEELHDEAELEQMKQSGLF